MLKLLYLYKSRQNLWKMLNNYHRGFAKELQKQCHTQFYGPFFDSYDPALIQVPLIIKKLYKNDYPDAIFYLHLHGGPIYSHLNQITTIPKLCLNVDAQNRLDKYSRLCKFTTLLNCISKPNLPKPIPKEIQHQMMPHCVDPNFFYDRGLERKFDVCFSGATGRDYPLRRLIVPELIKDCNKDIKTLIMPGRAPHADETRTNLTNEINKVNSRVGMNFRKITYCITGEMYPRLISQSKILIFDNTVYKYPLNKMFEGMACKTLVMCDTPHNANELGFVDGVTFVNINKINFMSKIRYYLQHPNQMNRIINNAYKLIINNHTHKIRVTQLLNFLNGKTSTIYSFKEAP